MSNASEDLQEKAAVLLEASAELSAITPVIRRREKDVENDMDAGLAVQKGITIFVMKPTPTSALQEVPFLFFDGYELRVRIIELPSINSSGKDANDLVEPVAHALHWQTFDGMLAQPLMIARRPIEMAEGKTAAPGFEHNGQFIRIIDVLFNAVLQVNPPTD